MGRKPRVEYEGALYHVIQRAINGDYIFAEADDKLCLLREIAEVKRSEGLRLFGYVLMSNHYHLIVQTLHRPLSKAMHRINGSFSRQYNRKYGRKGPNFQGRYRAALIQDERYLLAVLRYVHQNPVRAGLCRRAADYAWSSDQDYRGNRYGLVDIDLVLDYLADNRREAIKQYAFLMEAPDEGRIDYEAVDAIGEESFQQAVQPRRPEPPPRRELADILAATGAGPADLRLIREGSRRRHLIPYKTAYAREAWEQNYTLDEIGAYIGLSGAAVFKLINGG